MALSDLKVRKFTLPEGKKQVKLYDGNGLYLLVNKSGKYWRYDCKVNGKRKTISLGPYPALGIKGARTRLAELKLALAKGEDPTRKLRGSDSPSFSEVASKWLESHKQGISERYARTLEYRLERYLLPELGNRPINTIDARLLFDVLTSLQSSGLEETAHRARFICGQIFRYAVMKGLVEYNPVPNLRGALRPRRPKHMATILEPDRIGELVRAIDGYHGEAHVAIALKMALYTFVRSGELRFAKWSEFDMDGGIWRIPAERMKMKRMHLVPLSRQVQSLLERLHPITGSSELLFPSLRTKTRPISDATLTAALRRLGFSKDEIVVHGFRSMASTLLHEQGWPTDAIERQLAHVEKNKVKRAYDHAEHLDARKEMMQAWADYLDKLGGSISRPRS